jgi:hypothetical protein
MNNLLESLIGHTKTALKFSPLLFVLPLLFYSVADDSGKQRIDSLIMQTPAKGLIGGTHDYYPSYLDDEDIVIHQKSYVDENGEEFIGALIEVKKPVAFATPRDTGSMQPMFGAGNMLIQEIVDENTVLETGDIIVYRYEGNMIIHQIVGEVEGCYITKGMNNALPDSVCVTHDMVKYRMLFAIPTS